jgi:lipopolysaccharide/colanic/teichoic acid biosynthesis glycosyltransferase
MTRLARVLLPAGVIIVVAGASKLHAARIADPPYDYTGSSRFSWTLLYAVLLIGAAYGVGLPDLARRPQAALALGVAAAGGAAIAISIVQLVVGDALLPRVVVFGSAVILVPWFMACALLASGGRARAEAADAVLLVASVDQGAILGRELARFPEHPARLVAQLSVEEAAGTERGDPLVEAVRRAGARVVVLDRVALNDERIIAQVSRLHADGIRVRSLSLFYEEWLGKLPLAELERTSLMFDIGEIHRARYGRVKRLFDLGVVVPGLVALALVLPWVLVGDLAANRGPIFFSQERVGKGGRSFRIIKFRTMLPSSDIQGEWTAVDDARITPFGRLLRRTHLDELPQVLNIARGDLSVVGPRPEQPQYVEQLRRSLPFYDLRHLVRPGLTGWAQVKYPYGGSELDALEKLQYEFYYLRHQDLALDLRIAIRTLRSVLLGGGR